MLISNDNVRFSFVFSNARDRASTVFHFCERQQKLTVQRHAVTDSLIDKIYDFEHTIASSIGERFYIPSDCVYSEYI